MVSIAGHIKWLLEANPSIGDEVAMSLIKKAVGGDTTASLAIVLCSLFAKAEPPLEPSKCATCDGTQQVFGAVCHQCGGSDGEEEE